MRLDAQINGFAKQRLLGSGITPFLRQTKALLERCNQLTPPSVRNGNGVQAMTGLCRFIMRRLNGR